MSLVRCTQHPPDETDTKVIYEGYARAIGGNFRALICGREDCYMRGEVWLDQDEYQQYKNGIRIFASLADCSAKYEVERDEHHFQSHRILPD